MRLGWIIAVLMTTALIVSGVAEAQVTTQQPPDQPVLITADELSQDEELGTIVARGNVEITQGERVLLANTVSYNQKSDTVSASGNVTLMEPGGEVIFAEFVELTDKLKNGIVRQLRILLTDESRFAASEAERRDGNLTIMKRAVYSPCEACKKDPSRPLVWQIKAENVEHDQERQEIRYRNAFLEMFGVPVVYVPYFSHPDPTVKRKSGRHRNADLYQGRRLGHEWGISSALRQGRD
jgi:LPS-assembly protein